MEHLVLLLPLERNWLKQPRQRYLWPLPSVNNCLDDIRCKQR